MLLSLYGALSSDDAPVCPRRVAGFATWTELFRLVQGLAQFAHRTLTHVFFEAVEV
jgi:hypothetical protein